MDRRVQATQHDLVKALRQLMQRYPWQTITIASICQESEISRSTFYSHFTGKEELMQLSFERLSQELASTGTRRGLETSYTLKFLPGLLAHIKDHRQILANNSDSPAAGLILRNMRKTIEELLKTEIDTARYANTVDPGKLIFISGGIVAIVEHWNDNEYLDSTDSVLAIIDAQIKTALQRT